AMQVGFHRTNGEYFGTLLVLSSELDLAEPRIPEPRHSAFVGLAPTCLRTFLCATHRAPVAQGVRGRSRFTLDSRMVRPTPRLKKVTLLCTAPPLHRTASPF